MIACGCVWGCVTELGMCVSYIVSYALHLHILGKCYAVHINDKRIVTITKVYIARNNIHVEIIRLRKN